MTVTGDYLTWEYLFTKSSQKLLALTIDEC